LFFTDKQPRISRCVGSVLITSIASELR
jgi:hypothetical protein